MTLAGNVHLAGSKTVASPQEGLVEAVYTRAGDPIRDGKPIALISSEDLEQEIRATDHELEQKRREYGAYVAEQALKLSMLKRSVTSSEGAEEEAARNAERLRDLAALGAVPSESARTAEIQARSEASELEDRRDSVALEELRGANRVMELEADLRLLEQKAARNERERELCTIRSPADGTVLKMEALRGAYVGRFESVAVIADSSAPLILARLPNRYLESVSLGFPAAVLIGKATVPAQVTAIGTEVHAEGSGFGSVLDIQVSLLEPRERLVEGMPAVVALVTGRHPDALFVKCGPFSGTNQERFVFKLLGRTAVRTEVRFGLVTETEVEILEGLETGDRIIASEYTEFIDQEEVTVDPMKGGVQ